MPVGRGEVARCWRCGGRLYASPRLSEGQGIALVLAAFIVLVIANVYPILDVRVQGQANAATLWQTLFLLWEDDKPLVALMVGATTQVFPLLDIGLTGSVLAGIAYARRSGRLLPWVAPVLRVLLHLRPWGMIEVFMLGVLVALVKLSAMATVVPGIALWAFGALTVLLAALLGLDLLDFWGRVAPRPVPVRKPESLGRTWALLSAAVLLYVPANVLPIMQTQSLWGTQRDTILSGVIYFWHSGSPALAVLIFAVSVMIPLLKMGALAVLAIVARRGGGDDRNRRAATVLYRGVEAVGRWSMLDVFVVALMVGLVHFQGLAQVDAGPGAAAFGGVVVLTMLAAHSFDPRLLWDPPRPKAQPERPHGR